jgi:hypothetical protein
VAAVDFVALVREFGPWVSAVIFFIWRDFKREERLTGRITVLEDQQRSVILPLVEKTSTVIAHNTEVMGRLEKSLELAVCKYKDSCEFAKSHATG